MTVATSKTQDIFSFCLILRASEASVLILNPDLKEACK